ncbi:unnamed protein product [Moneuplotes crassus]|uniref:histidine kinase n=1 Tax=Euplotes crassus TaxID=5936 RepID=A0AAD1Y249_EUPCR|nr:unnamed protein product [Moneuplotes crassus]
MLGFLYYLTKIVEKRGEIPTDFWIAMVPAFFYYVGTSYIMNEKLRELYGILLKIKATRNEATSILETFPYAFMIHPADSEIDADNCFFTNEEFNEKIFDFKNSSTEISNISVEFDQTTPDGEVKVKCDLKEYLDQVHKRMTNLDIFEQSSVRIYRGNACAHDKLKEDQVYTIKSIEVKWRGQCCFMDVFISGSDTARLNQAQNNIKNQKAMFDRISNEFKASLGSIMSSIKTVEHNMKEVVDFIASRHQPNKDFKDSLRHHSKEIFGQLKAVRSHSQLLESLAKDSVDIPKIEANTFNPCMGNLDLNDLVNQVHDICTYQCKQRDLEFTMQMQECLENLTITSDRNIIMQAILNLFVNSLQHMDKGSIHISFKAKQATDHNYIQFTITDTGTGIDQEDQEKLQEMLEIDEVFKAYDINEREIGLVIAKKYINQLQGKIKFTSLKRGTTVRFIIPANSKSKIPIIKGKYKASCSNLVIKGFVGKDENYWPISDEPQELEIEDRKHFNELMIGQDDFNEMLIKDISEDISLSGMREIKLLTSINTSAMN